ncbi:MAG: cupin domain-containing protein [Terriglobia bacterium]
MWRSRTRWLLCLAAVIVAASVLVPHNTNEDARASEAHSAGALTAPVRFFSAADMSAAFAKGKNLIDEPGLNYKVMTSRRESAGEVEVHTHYTDILYIIRGAASFVTGGRLIRPKTLAPGEVRGESIEGGVTHQLEKGSLVVIPAGTPHWFRSVPSPVVYLTIKVRTR